MKAAHDGDRQGAVLAETQTVHLTFMPGAITVTARRGDTLLDAALDNGVTLPHECGGNCACTTCHVHILAGTAYLSGMEDVEVDRLTSAEGFNSVSRLGCQAILRGGDVTAFIVENDMGSFEMAAPLIEH